MFASCSCNCALSSPDCLQTWVTNQTSQRSKPLTRPNWRRLRLWRKTHCQQKRVCTATGLKWCVQMLLLKMQLSLPSNRAGEVWVMQLAPDAAHFASSSCLPSSLRKCPWHNKEVTLSKWFPVIVCASSWRLCKPSNIRGTFILSNTWLLVACKFNFLIWKTSL